MKKISIFLTTAFFISLAIWSYAGISGITPASHDPSVAAITSGTIVGANITNTPISGSTGSFTTLTTTSDATIGSATAGKNLTTYATLGNEMAPALETANWTLGYDTGGWTATGGVMTKTASTGTLTSTPSGTFTVTAGRRYQVTIVCSAVSGALTYTLGGVMGSTITATTITDNIIASTTGKIIFSGASTVTATITSVSVKEATTATGDLTAGGSITAKNQIVIPISGVAYPGLSFSKYRQTGIYESSGDIFFSYAGTQGAKFGTTYIQIPQGGWYSIGTDTYLYREAANNFAFRNSTTQQIVNIYNTYTNSSNYERLAITGVQGSSVNITAETAGTGGDNIDIVMTPAGTGATKILPAGTANRAVCWKTGGALGYCSSVVGADGSCTCN